MNSEELNLFHLIFKLHQRVIKRKKQILKLKEEMAANNKIQNPYLRIRVVSIDLEEIMNGNNFKVKEHLRVSADTLLTIVGYMPPKQHGWSPEYEVICFLYWMACGCSYRVAGGFMGISRKTVSDIIHKMLDIFLGLKHLISPGTTEDYHRISLKFCQRGKTSIFNKCVGAIDGTHVRVQCKKNQQDAFMSHKGSYTYQVQAVADSAMMFKSVFIGYPGSVHDTRVLKKSPLYNECRYPAHSDYYLLGDKGYPCIANPIAIITPFKNPRTAQQKSFNAAHSRARNVVECSFGILKTRWRNIFNRDLELNRLNAVKTIFAAFVLHNICMLKEDFNPYPVEYLEEPATRLNETNDTQDGLEIRNLLFNDYVRENIVN